MAHQDRGGPLSNRLMSRETGDGPISRVSTVAAVIVAAGAAYGGIAVATALVGANADAKTVGGGMSYVTAALLVPAFLGWRKYRRGAATGWGAVRTAAAISVLVHLLLSPIAITVMSM